MVMHSLLLCVPATVCGQDDERQRKDKDKVHHHYRNMKTKCFFCKFLVRIGTAILGASSGRTAVRLSHLYNSPLFFSVADFCYRSFQQSKTFT